MSIRTVSSNNADLDKFYEKYFLFSYSSLNKLLFSPSLFYSWYIKGEREDQTESHLMDGRVIHCLFLEEKNFDKQFVVMPGDVPGDTIRKIISKIYAKWKETPNTSLKLSYYSKEILDWLEDNNLHQSLTDDKDLTKTDAKTGDQKRLAKILTIKAKDYFNHMKLSHNKDVIDLQTLDKCKEAVDELLDNDKVVKLMRHGETETESVKIYNEKMLSCKLGSYSFGLKGIVDNYVIDHNQKKIFINDLKTSGKGLSKFSESLDYYKYWMQAAIYSILVISNHPEAAGYEVVFHFVVIDNYNNVYPFPVSDKSLQDWQNQLKKVLESAKYHYTKKEYKLPYDFATGNVVL